MTTHPWGTAQGVSPYPRCTITVGCEYAAGHHGDCTPVEVGKHVRKLRDRQQALFYRRRLDAIMAQTEAQWFGHLVDTSTTESFSPLLIVGWVSVRISSGGYKTVMAETWHRERMCKLNRASGSLVPVLYYEMAGNRQLKACRGCAQLTDDEKAGARAEYKRLRDLQLIATDGICWGGSYRQCGRDVEPNKTSCAEHLGLMTLACFDGDHTACDNVLETKTRPDGSTYTLPCGCWVCH